MDTYNGHFNMENFNIFSQNLLNLAEQQSKLMFASQLTVEPDTTSTFEFGYKVGQLHENVKQLEKLVNNTIHLLSEISVFMNGNLNSPCENNETLTKDDEVKCFEPTQLYPVASEPHLVNSQRGSHEAVMFFIDFRTSMPMARYEGIAYKIGVLDLTYQEFCYLKMIKSAVVLPIIRNHIHLRNNKLSIRRFNEQKLLLNQSTPFLCEFSNLERIQFSTTEPLMAKYDDEIFLVSGRLQSQYIDLLERVKKRVKKSSGAAIRIDKRHLIVDMGSQMLDIVPSTSFQNHRVVCSISGVPPSHISLSNYTSDEYRRIVFNQLEMLIVDASLIHPFECTDIYLYEDAGSSFTMPQPDYTSCERFDNGNIEKFDGTIEETLKSLDDWVSDRLNESVKKTGSNADEQTEFRDIDLNEFSGDDDDSAFFNQLFTDITPKYDLPSDTRLTSGGIECKEDSYEAVVKFSIDKEFLMAVTECQNTEYRIGFLDLTEEEYSYMTMIEWTVELSIATKDIQLHGNKFHIKRIEDYEMSSTEIIAPKFRYIEFSTTEPLMAKYNSEIYFVGIKLYAEYMNLLDRIRKYAGINIQIEKKYVIIDQSTQTLDLRKYCGDYVSFEDLKIISSIGYSNESREFRNECETNNCRRYVVSNDSFELYEVDPKLIFSLKSDAICLYGADDFVFDKYEWEQIQSQSDEDESEIEEHRELTDEDICWNE